MGIQKSGQKEHSTFHHKTQHVQATSPFEK